MFDTELENFKTRIDLRCYAAGQGYQLDRKESSLASAVMRHPTTDDKVVIKRGSDNHWIWFSVRADEGGSIIDFAQHILGLSLGAVRKELRPWMGQPPVPVPAFPALPKTTSKDRLRVETEYAKMRDALRHPYLENERALPASLLASERFSGRVRVDSKGNAAFPHFDGDGVCGYEIKNSGFTGFAAGGTKGLWLSHEKLEDNRLVISESAIDSLSFAVLFPDPDDRTRYASIGGKPNPIQPELIRAAVARMPVGSEIVSAMDADAEGGKLADVVRRAVELSGRDDLRFTLQEPFGFKDFNDQLRAKPKPSFPYCPAEPSVA